MNRNATPAPETVRAQAPGRPEAADRTTDRLPYTPPRLERLGGWSALTLQQSVVIFP